MPHVVSGIAWLLLANPSNGPLSLLVHQVTGLTVDIYSIGGMIFLTGILACLEVIAVTLAVRQPISNARGLYWMLRDRRGME